MTNEEAEGFISMEEEYEKYNSDVKNMTEYLIIQGLYNERKGQDYYRYKTINEDIETWKQYDVDLELNDHKMLEIPLNLSDLVLQGTSDTVEEMSEVITRI